MMRFQVQFEVTLDVSQHDTCRWLSYVRRIIREMAHAAEWRIEKLNVRTVEERSEHDD